MINFENGKNNLDLENDAIKEEKDLILTQIPNNLSKADNLNNLSILDKKTPLFDDQYLVKK